MYVITSYSIHYTKLYDEMLFRHFADAEKECHALLEKGVALPAYDQCIKA